MDAGGPKLAGDGGRDVLDWDKLQRAGAREREVVLVSPEREAKVPFALIQRGESEGVEIRIGTFAGGSNSGYRVRRTNWRMPENAKECRIAQEGLRWT